MGYGGFGFFDDADLKRGFSMARGARGSTLTSKDDGGRIEVYEISKSLNLYSVF